MPYLDTSAKGVDRVFGGTEETINTQPLEVNEAADLTNVVFSWMHYFASSQYLPMGFSRNGMLKAPETKEQYLHRITELKRGIGFIVTGLINPQIPLEAIPSALRTQTFFRVGAMIPLKFPDNEKTIDQRERSKFNDLLKDIIF